MQVIPHPTRSNRDARLVSFKSICRRLPLTYSHFTPPSTLPPILYTYTLHSDTPSVRLGCTPPSTPPTILYTYTLHSDTPSVRLGCTPPSTPPTIFYTYTLHSDTPSVRLGCSPPSTPPPTLYLHSTQRHPFRKARMYASLYTPTHSILTLYTATPLP